jgi:hypothetical protein
MNTIFTPLHLVVGSDQFHNLQRKPSSLKAPPSLYRYFPHKEALEVAVAEEILNVMLRELRGVEAFLSHFHGRAEPVWRGHSTRATEATSVYEDLSWWF